MGFSCSSAGKEPTYNEGDLGLILGLGKSSRVGKGYPLQYSGLENSMDRITPRCCRLSHDWVTFTFTTFPLQCPKFSRTAQRIQRNNLLKFTVYSKGYMSGIAKQKRCIGQGMSARACVCVRTQSFHDPSGNIASASQCIHQARRSLKLAL